MLFMNNQRAWEMEVSQNKLHQCKILNSKRHCKSDSILKSRNEICPPIWTLTTVTDLTDQEGKGLQTYTDPQTSWDQSKEIKVIKTRQEMPRLQQQQKQQKQQEHEEGESDPEATINMLDSCWVQPGNSGRPSVTFPINDWHFNQGPSYPTPPSSRALWSIILARLKPNLCTNLEEIE